LEKVEAGESEELIVGFSGQQGRHFARLSEVLCHWPFVANIAVSEEAPH
jgi:hypothetical protein